VVYDLFKRTLGAGPVYVTLGNHDSYNQCALLFSLMIQSEQFFMHRRAQDAPRSLGGALANQFSWSASILILSLRRELRIFFIGTTIMSLHYGSWSTGFLRVRFLRHALTTLRIACSAPTDCALFPLTLTYVSAAASPGLIWAHTACMTQGTGMVPSDAWTLHR
jgi:hypothetical protein